MEFHNFKVEEIKVEKDLLSFSASIANQINNFN